jgi:hypothetical protein
MATGMDSTSAAMTPAAKDPTFLALHAELYGSKASPFSVADTSAASTSALGVTTADSPAQIVPTSSRPGDTTLAAGPAAPVATDTRPATATTPAATDTTAAATTPAATDASTAAAPGNCSTFNYGDNGSAADDPRIVNWNPNPNSKSQLTQNWFAAHGQLESVAPEDGPYTVKFGDCLESIARRELKKENKGVDGQSVKDEVAKIIKLNQDHYKSLATKSAFIKDGWKLKLTDCNDTAPAPTATDTTAATTPPAKADCPDVIIEDRGGDIYYNDKKVGSHDRVTIKNGVATESAIPDRRAGQPAPDSTAAATPAGTTAADSTAPAVATTDSTTAAVTPTPAVANAPDASTREKPTTFPVLDAVAPVTTPTDTTTTAATPSDHTDALTPGPAGTPDTAATAPKIVNQIAAKQKPDATPAQTTTDGSTPDASSLGPA